MEKNIDYTLNEFGNLLDSLEKHPIANTSYIGTGNPNAKILIIGKECAIDLQTDNGQRQYQREIKNNLNLWLQNSKTNLQYTDIQDWFTNIADEIKFNPLFPFYGQLFKKDRINKNGESNKGTNATWMNYQKLIDKIRGVSRTNDKLIDFHKFTFISELNDVCFPKSPVTYNHEIAESIKQRTNNLFNQSFFQSFPVVIVATGMYQRLYQDEIDLQKCFKVTWDGKTNNVSEKNYNWFNVHHSSQGTPKLVIHTNQLSMNITDELLTNISKVCVEFIQKNHITL